MSEKERLSERVEALEAEVKELRRMYSANGERFLCVARILERYMAREAAFAEAVQGRISNN